MSTSFNFPLNPEIGDIVTLPDGSEAEWNGYAWVASGGGSDVTYPISIDKGGTGAITAPEALTNLGITTSTGEFIIPDGSITNPGLAFASEPTLGWYKASQGVVNFSTQGFDILTLGTNDPISSSLGILPQAPGIASFNMYGNIAGTLDMPLLGIGIDGRAAGTAYISSITTGAGTALPIVYTAPTHTFSGNMTVSGTTDLSGLNVIGIELGRRATADIAVLDFHAQADVDYSVRVFVDPGIPQKLNIDSLVTTTILRVGGTAGGISFDNVDASAGNPIAFGWRSDATLGLRVDGSQFGAMWPISISGSAGSAPANGGTAQNSNQVGGIGGWTYRNDANNPVYIWCTEGDAQSQHLTQPANLSVNYANTAGYANNAYAGQDRCNNWGFASGNYNQPYMRLDSSDPIRLLIYQTYGNDTIGGIALTAITGGSATFEMSGTSGAWGITAAPSDERLKQNIVPATINATDIVNRITLKEYDIGDIHTTVGFSAQNLQTIDESMVFGVDQPEDSPMHEFGTILNPDIHRILAYVTKALQETIARLDLLENK